MPKAPADLGMPNSTQELAQAAIEVMKRYQDLGHDIEVLRDFLRSPHPNPNIGIRVLACIHTSSSVIQALVNMQIHAMREK